MQIKFAESNLYQGFKALVMAHEMDLAVDKFEKTVPGIFEGLANWMAQAKRPNKPIVCTIRGYKDEVLGLCYCKYVAPAEGQDETAGSWLIDFSFNAEDIPDGAYEINVNDPILYSFFDNAIRKRGFTFPASNIPIVFAISFFQALLDWLDANASEAEEVELVFDRVFTAKVAVEGGVKVVGLVVDEEIKDIVKGEGDALLASEKDATE